MSLSPSETQSNQFPELLCPAGNFEKLKIALLYGADAVYLAGQKYGLRSAADNFTWSEIKEATELAHSLDKKIYLTLNSFFHDQDFSGFLEYIQFLDLTKVDAVICSDMGVIQTILENTSIEVHLSTQASTVNSYAAKLWKKMGVKRIVVGRELGIEESSTIKKEAGIEIEMFVHGAMCMAYSGHCTISNYTSGRDSNRGGCIQSCRYMYHLDGKKEETQSFQFLSSKDLNGLNSIEKFKELSIDSLKVEGRMKSNLYIASVTRAYANTLESLKKGEPLDLQSWEQELNKIPHRDYTNASIEEKAGSDSVYSLPQEEMTQYELAGTIVELDQEKKRCLLYTKNKMLAGLTLEVLPFIGKHIEIQVDTMMDVLNKSVEQAQPHSMVWIPWVEGIKVYNVVRFNTEQRRNLLENNAHKNTKN